MRLALCIFFLMGMVSMTFVTPNILTEINFAEIVEDETHPVKTFKEVIKENKEYYFSYDLVSRASDVVFKTRFAHYSDIYESTHVLEVLSPPPNA